MERFFDFLDMDLITGKRHCGGFLRRFPGKFRLTRITRILSGIFKLRWKKYENK